jgi:hypothetical protein
MCSICVKAVMLWRKNAAVALQKESTLASLLPFMYRVRLLPCSSKGDVACRLKSWIPHLPGEEQSTQRRRIIRTPSPHRSAETCGAREEVNVAQ